MNIPTFKSTEHQEEFELIFAEKAVTYIKLMDVVKELMYGTGHGNYANLPGTCQEVLNDITRSLLYDAEYTFKAKHPEYKTDDDELFIPRKSFKEDVTEALLEANQKFWNSSNEMVQSPTYTTTTEEKSTTNPTVL